MRYRENRLEDLMRARATVAAWRGQYPRGTGEQLVEDLGGQFHRDYGVVLRAVLFAVDSHAAKITAGQERTATGGRPSGPLKCLACMTVEPRPEQTCHQGRDHLVGFGSGCPACGRLVEACAARPCATRRLIILRGR